MIPKKFEIRVFQFCLTAIMTLFISGAVTLINLGPAGFSFLIWMKAWMLTWPVALIVIIFAAPVAQKITKHLIKTD